MAEHSAEISQNYRGKYIAVGNEEVFTGRTKEEVVKLLGEKYLSRRTLPCQKNLSNRLMVMKVERNGYDRGQNCNK